MAGRPDTLKGAKLYVCTTAQTALPLNQSAFAALTWVAVGNVGNISDVSTDTNIVTYDTLDTDVSQKGKGVTNGGDWVVEVGYVADDAGQIALRAAALLDRDYAVKFELNDKSSDSYTNTVIYNCGRIVGPRRTFGGVEDFATEEFTIACNQREVHVPSAAV